MTKIIRTEIRELIEKKTKYGQARLKLYSLISEDGTQDAT